MPAAARVLGEAGVPPHSVSGTGPGQRVTKADATSAVSDLLCQMPHHLLL